MDSTVVHSTARHHPVLRLIETLGGNNSVPESVFISEYWNCHLRFSIPSAKIWHEFRTTTPRLIRPESRRGETKLAPNWRLLEHRYHRFPETGRITSYPSIQKIFTSWLFVVETFGREGFAEAHHEHRYFSDWDLTQSKILTQRYNDIHTVGINDIDFQSYVMRTIKSFLNARESIESSGHDTAPTINSYT